MPAEYLGINTQKAIKNFPFNFRRTPIEFMHTVALIKKASAIAHHKVGELDNLKKQAIVRAAEEILAGKFDEQFVLPGFQGGAGTSNHMNVNEVIGMRATEILEKQGKKLVIHPNDHVNMSQSTNDVMPSAARITALQMKKSLLASFDLLIRELTKKAKEYKGIHKLGRTHMQDAVPVSLGSEFMAFADTLRKASQRIVLASEAL
jgi:aspartate ammonia-lyase